MNEIQKRKIDRLIRERFASPTLLKIARRSDLTVEQADLVIKALKQAPFRVKDRG